MNEQHEFNTTYSVVHEFTVLETSLAATALCIIILMTIIGNCTICYVVFKNKRMRTVMNFFLVNLAVGDLAVGFLSMVFPLVTAVKRRWIFNETICQINAACNSVLFCSTIFIHTVISIDRYFALVRPMKKFMTAKKAAIMILLVWAFSAVIVLGPFFGWGHMEFNPTTLQCGYGFPRSKYESLYIILLVIIAFVIPLIIMTALYIRIFISLRGHSRRMSTAAVAGNQHQATLKAQIRVGATFFLALLAFFVCWAPFCAFIAFAVIVKDRTSIPHGLGIAAYWCGFVNSLCNPFIVGIRSEQFRAAFAEILCCCCIRPQRRPPSVKTSIAFSNGQRRSKMNSASRRISQSNTDTDTRATDSTYAKESSKRGYVVDARQIREELDRDAAERDAMPEYDRAQNDIFSPNQRRTRKTSTKRDQPPERDVPYKLFIHVIGGASFRESGV